MLTGKRILLVVSGGIAERAQFLPQCVATALIVGLFYPFFEGIVWNKNYGLQESLFAAKLGMPRPQAMALWVPGGGIARLVTISTRVARHAAVLAIATLSSRIRMRSSPRRSSPRRSATRICARW